MRLDTIRFDRMCDVLRDENLWQHFPETKHICYSNNTKNDPFADKGEWCMLHSRDEIFAACVADKSKKEIVYLEVAAPYKNEQQSFEQRLKVCLNF